MNMSRCDWAGSSKRARRRCRFAHPLLLVGAGFAALASLAVPAGAAVPPSSGAAPGAVYVASNSFTGNTIQTFLRAADGSLTPSGSPVATGGLGSGPGTVVGDDPLGSQNSLVADQDRQQLFAVNAASNDVSVFALARSGPTLVDRQPSGGGFPVSLAYANKTLFVLNGVGNSVTGFKVDSSGHLSTTQTCGLPALPAGDGVLPGNTVSSPQPVPTQIPGQVGFSPDGKKLVVVSKEGPLLDNGNFPFGADLGPGHIYVYDVDAKTDTLANCAPKTTTLPNNAVGRPKFPFSFAWDAQSHLVVVEVFGTSTSFAGSALSSYTLGHDGSLTPISTSVGNGQPASCWIVRSGKFFFVANYFGDNVSSYSVTSKGELTVSPTPAASFGPGFTQATIDMAVTPNGRFAYQLTAGSALIRPFAVSSTGTLTELTPISDGKAPHSGQMGIATIDFQ